MDWTQTRRCGRPDSRTTTARPRPRRPWRTRGSDRSGGRARSPHPMPGSCRAPWRPARRPTSSGSPRRPASLVRKNGCLPAGLDGRDLLLVAAAGRALVAATDNLLFMRAAEVDGDSKTSDGDDGASFTVIAGLTERPRALALGADGAAIVADDDGVLVIGGDGSTGRILNRPTDAVAVCGGVAMALADDGVYRWTPGTVPVRTSDRPPVPGNRLRTPGRSAVDRDRPGRLDLAGRGNLDGEDRNAGTKGRRSGDHRRSRLARDRQRSGRARSDRPGAWPRPSVGRALDGAGRRGSGLRRSRRAGLRGPYPPLAGGHRSLRRRAHAQSPQLAGDDAADVSARPRRRTSRQSDDGGSGERPPGPVARAQANRPRRGRHHR